MTSSWDAIAFIEELRASPEYAGQVVHVHEAPARKADYRMPAAPLSPPLSQALARLGVDRLYAHQAEALDHVRAGANVVVATGTASGKSLCYAAPVLESLAAEPAATAFLVFPTKALTQDQFGSFTRMLEAAGLAKDVVAGVCDGDTSSSVRKRLRDRGRVIFTNPDMIHASMMAHHSSWSRLIENLHWLVFDELHAYGGMFGSNVANLVRRFLRVCEYRDSSPQIIACSGTIANPRELAEELFGRPFALVDRDGSPRGRRVFVFWNPPAEREGRWRTRRSANVEAHELMARLVARGVPTITFSKAKMTAEMIHRYVRERLEREAPHLVAKVAPYRGGYLPEERRAIEARLFAGDLLGVSTTPALELGIDVGGLDASVIVGYPGTLASFLQQAGRAGRRDRDSIVILVGLDTPVNQYVMSHPEYLFARPVEQAVIDADNPFVVSAHLRCAAHELPIDADEAPLFGAHARVALEALADSGVLRRLGAKWFHAAVEVPHLIVSLREFCQSNVVIRDVDTDRVLGEVNRYDAQPIVHPGAVYMHQGETYLVLDLDFEKDVALVRRVDLDYYTQPLGGTDVNHIDRIVRRKPFGAGTAHWGEVTAHFQTRAYERIRFYALDAISQHEVDLPTFVLESTAFWITVPEPLVEGIRRAGLNPHNGLRGMGYATRSLLPMFMSCQTLDFSHSVGAANAPWHTVFVYERFPLGLGLTHAAYGLLHVILPAVREHVRACPCSDGCPQCVGKPLRGFTTWNVERGEAAIPSKQATIAVLDGLLGEGSDLEAPDDVGVARDEADAAWVEDAMRRRLARLGETWEAHAVLTASELEAEYLDRRPPS